MDINQPSSTRRWQASDSRGYQKFLAQPKLTHVGGILFIVLFTQVVLFRGVAYINNQPSAQTDSPAPCSSDSSIPCLHTSNENQLNVRAAIPPAPVPDLAVAAGALEQLYRSRPSDTHLLTRRNMADRIKSFRTYLQSSDDLRSEWNARFAAAAPRGILMPAGRATALLNAFPVLHVLRNTLNCSLPVVVSYYGDEELSNITKSFFQQHISGITFVDLEKLPFPRHHIPLHGDGTDRRNFGYKLKVWALYTAPFREVIMLDADSLPLQDPNALFDTQPYKEQGNIFWPDFWQSTVDLWGALGLTPSPWDTAFASNPMPFVGKESTKPLNIQVKQQAPAPIPKQYDIFEEHNNDLDVDSMVMKRVDKLINSYVAGGIKNSAVDVFKSKVVERRLVAPFQAEAGQVVLDMVQHWDVLEWILFLNTHESYVYRHCLGDKDTYRVAFALADKEDEYWQSQFSPSLPLTDIGSEGPYGEVRYWDLGMLQLHPVNGSPFFLHRTADAKFQPLDRDNYNSAPITHVTPSVTQEQASIMLWNDPSYTIFNARGPVHWGLHEDSIKLMSCAKMPTTMDIKEKSLGADDVKVAKKLPRKMVVAGGRGGKENPLPVVDEETCQCPPLALHEADERCNGRTTRDQLMDPLPIAVIQVPEDSYIYQASKAEVEAIGLIPFQEDL